MVTESTLMDSQDGQSQETIAKTTPLSEIKAAGRHGSFVVQVKYCKLEEYDYKRQGNQVPGKRLLVLFASNEESMYVVGKMVMWQQKADELKTAAARFQVGLHFVMSKLSFMTKEQPEFIGGPLKVVIDLRQTSFKPVLQGVYSPFCVAPPTKLKDILELTDGRQRFDATVLVALQGDVRTPNTKQGERWAQDLQLRDGSRLANGSLAEVVTCVFFETESKMKEFHDLIAVEQPLTFFGLDVHVSHGDIKVNPSFQDFRWELAVGSHAEALAGKAQVLWKTTSQVLTHEWQPSGSGGIDYDRQPAYLCCCALLDAFAHQTDSQLHDQVFQLNNVHIPYPPKDHWFEKRIFWSTRIRDFSGGLDVAIRQKAA